MDWTRSLKQAIDYIEVHLLEDINADEVAEKVYISSFHFQKGFKLITGYTISEYIRGRRLYLAALDCLKGKKIIDLAYQYGYDTPESFTKAFKRFHGITPNHLQGDSKKIKPFLPLKISISIQGGNDMDYCLEKSESFKLVGIEAFISYDNNYQAIPAYWDEFNKQYSHLDIVQECKIGEFAVCKDLEDDLNGFYYMIAGRYDGRAIPKGLKVFEIPSMIWAKFSCIGPLPGSLQSVNTKIYQQWFPDHPNYKIAMNIAIERYSLGNINDKDYKSEIWLPIK